MRTASGLAASLVNDLSFVHRPHIAIMSVAIHDGRYPGQPNELSVFASGFTPIA